MRWQKKLWKLLLSTLYISAFTFGGGFVIITFMKRKFVDELHWINEEEMLDMTVLAQSSTGAIAINSATFVGIRIAGIPGALVATFGCILPSCFIVSLLSYIYRRYKNLSTLQNVLSCLRPAVVALIASAGFTILQLVAFGGSEMGIDNLNLPAIVLFAVALVILRWKKWNPIVVMLLCGVVYLTVCLLSDVIRGDSMKWKKPVSVDVDMGEYHGINAGEN
ncbi:MAG: chromate transporter [Sphaerochaetaceae bacterium]|nr:chromate transporter [Sphaerochaetaceae bacterium]